MAQLAKLEVKVEIESSADKFYGFFKKQMRRLVQLFPENLKSYELLEGDETRAGSVARWKYDLGSPMTVKVKIEAVDDANRSITYAVLEGDLLQLYKSFKAKIQCSGAGYAKWTIEYEKANKSAPDPNIYKDFAAKLTKELDAYLSRT